MVLVFCPESPNNNCRKNDTNRLNKIMETSFHSIAYKSAFFALFLPTLKNAHLNPKKLHRHGRLTPFHVSKHTSQKYQRNWGDTML